MPKFDKVEVTEKAMMAAILKWKLVADELAEIKVRERDLRTFIIAQTFPKLKEGLNRVIHEHIEINVTHTVSRAVDDAVINSATKETFRKAGIMLDALIERKPVLVIKAYRLLNKTQMKLFDTALTIKDGSPQMKIVVGSPVKKK